MRTAPLLLLAALATPVAPRAAAQRAPAASATIPASAALPNPVLAVVHGERIDGETFRAHYGAYLVKAGVPDGVDLRRRVLSDLVARRLLVQEARAAGVERAPDYRAEEATTRRALLLALFAERALFADLTVTEADRESAFTRMNTAVTARHLYARTLDGARALKARLDAGETFEALAPAVFADADLAANGGLLPPFTYDDMDPAFEDAAMTLPVGQVSEPVRTEQGYSVLRVESRFTKPLASGADYARAQDNIAGFVQTRKRVAARTAFVQARSLALDARFDAATLADLFEALEGRAPQGAEALAERSLVTFTHEGRTTTWTVADFGRHAAYASDKSRARVASPADLEALVRSLAVQETVVQDALARGLDRDPAYARAVADKMELWIVLQQRAALARVDVPADSVGAAYARWASVLEMPARADVSEILVASAEEAARVRAALDGGADFDALAAARSVRPGAAGAKGRLGFVTSGQLGALGAPVFAARAGSVVGPLEAGGGHAFFRVHRVERARPMTEAEAEPIVRARLAEIFGARAVDTHLRGLRDAIGITVDVQALATLPLYAGQRPPAAAAR